MELISPFLTLVLPSTIYILLRVGLAVGLLHPESKIAVKLFSEYIKPILDKYEKDIDRNIDKAIKKGK